MSADEHELASVVRQDSEQMLAEYERLLRRSAEDPGTAGDGGELIWQRLLRSWLPSSYPVVTKGRIVSISGVASPQIDVLVLSPNYPQRLLEREVYMSHGVLAAFECKNTLTNRNLVDAMQRTTAFRRLYEARPRTPREAIYGPLMYGVLAHGHRWTRDAFERVDAIIDQNLDPQHPLNIPDVISVGSLATWRKLVVLQPPGSGPRDSATGLVTGTMLHTTPRERDNDSDVVRDIAALWSLLHVVLRHLARTDRSIRPLAFYFGLAGRPETTESARLGTSYLYGLVLAGMRERFEQYVSANSGGFADDDEWSIVHGR